MKMPKLNKYVRISMFTFGLFLIVAPLASIYATSMGITTGVDFNDPFDVDFGLWDGQYSNGVDFSIVGGEYRWYAEQKWGYIYNDFYSNEATIIYKIRFGNAQPTGGASPTVCGIGAEYGGSENWIMYWHPDMGSGRWGFEHYPTRGTTWSASGSAPMTTGVTYTIKIHYQIDTGLVEMWFNGAQIINTTFDWSTYGVTQTSFFGLGFNSSPYQTAGVSDEVFFDDCEVIDSSGGTSPTPSPTPTSSPTPAPTATPTPSPTPSPTASPTPLPSPSVPPQTNPDVVTVSLTSTSGGSTSPSAGVYDYSTNSSVQFQAIPDAGYRFDQWVLNTGVTYANNTITLTLTENIGLRAEFVADVMEPPKVEYDTTTLTVQMFGCVLCGFAVLAKPRKR